MDKRPIGVGDRVVGMQMPVVFVVTARRGHLLDLESDRGLRVVALESAIRRLDGSPPAPKDDAG
jgi:hypothetical protein